MKKFLSFLILLSIILSPNLAFAKIYLLTDHNYYTDKSVDKGILGQVMSDGSDGNPANMDSAVFSRLKQTISKNVVNLSSGMTFNDYFLANNLSPEDNFTAGVNPWYPIVDLRSGVKINSSPTKWWDLTYFGPADYKWGPYWNRDPQPDLDKPSFFSRLTVWELPKGTFTINPDQTQTPNEEWKLSLFSRDGYVFPSKIGYGEKATVNDYMLTSNNNFAIPARYNSLRDDVTLTMRSHGLFGAYITHAQVFLEAKDKNNISIQGKNSDPKSYINTTTSVFGTPIMYSQLWEDRLFWGFMLKGSKTLLREGLYQNISKNTLTNIGIDEFTTRMNKGLQEIQQKSGVRQITSWNGGQIRLSGFFRKSPFDSDFSASISDRKADSLHDISVKYFIFANKNLITYDGRAAKITTPLAPNGKNLYSPNVSGFSIEISRPYFSDFGDNSAEIIFDENNFDKKLWEKSVKIIETGIDKNSGDPLKIDDSRLKIRVSEDWQNFSDQAYSFEELKTFLQKSENEGKIFKIAYVYAGIDSKDEIIGKLPAEIADNSGAYAIPLLRTVKILQKFTLTTKYQDENGAEIATNEVEKLSEWESFQKNPKNLQNYEFIKTIGQENGIISSDTEIIFVYKKITKKGKISIKFVDENGSEILAKKEFSEEVGKNYNFSPEKIADYEFVKTKENNASGVYTDAEIEIVFIYKKIVKNPPVSTNTSGPGGYVSDAKLYTVEKIPQSLDSIKDENGNIFHLPVSDGKCVNHIKNLDDAKLISYYRSQLWIHKNRNVASNISRAEFAKLLMLASGKVAKNPQYGLFMADVSADSEYLWAISFALENNLFHGQTDGINTFFRPNDTITRAEAAKIFIRAAGASIDNRSIIFSDVNIHTDTLAPYIQSAYDHCLLHGRKTYNGQPINNAPRVFEPQSAITIAETAKVLYNMTN